MQIASYWASLGFRVEKRELRTVDSHLKQIESKLEKFSKKLAKSFSLQISKFDIDDKKLNIALGDALDRASNKVVLEIKRFDIDRAALQRAMNVSGVAGPMGRGFGNTYINNRVLGAAEWDRREAEKQRLWWERRNALREDELNRQRNRIRPGAGGGGGNSWWQGGVSNTTIMGAGGVAGLAARSYLPALAIAGGGYGLGALNRRNQEVVSAQLMTQAVVQQAGGTAAQGMQSFDWLMAQADRVGFNFLEAAPDFNKLLSGLTGAGMSVEQGQDVFRGFAELSRVNKLDKTSQNRLFRALSQVAGKNQLMSEELTGQIAEALPGGVAIFAEAYQRQIGGNLKGTEAIQALRKAMESRQVKGDILISAAQIASERAASGLGPASRASQAEQQRFQNALNRQAMVASNAGVESGFARLFRSFAIAMKESTPVIESLAKAFDELTKYISFATLLPQSIRRALEGRDSWVADMIGQSNVEIIRSFLDGMKDLGKEIKTTLGIAVDGWKMLFDEFGDELLAFINGIKNVLLYTFKALNSFLSGDAKAGLNNLGAIRATLAGKSQSDIEAVAAGKMPMPTLKETLMGDNAAWQYSPPAMVYKAYRENVYKPVGNAATAAWEYAKNVRDDRVFNQNTSGGSNILPGINVTVEQGAIAIQTAATDASGITESLKPHIESLFRDTQQKAFNETMLMFPNTGN